MPETVTLYIQSNSPGELSSWVQPLTKAFKHRHPSGKVVLCLVPCQYASGEEARIANKMLSIDEVWTPQRTVKEIFSFPLRKKKSKGIVFYAGGDPLYTQLLSLKFGIKAYGYTDHKKVIAPFIKKLFYKHEIGDLMADRALQFDANKHDTLKRFDLKDQEYCLFFAGSRPHHFKAFAPFLAQVAKAIQQQKPDFQAILFLSPFISDELFHELAKKHDFSHLHIRRGNSYKIMSISKLLVTLPGTNTAEAAYMGLPTLTVIPLNRPDLIQFNGLFGLIGNAPGIGTLIKKMIIAYLKTQKRYYALPNMMANEALVPEVAGVITVSEIASDIVNVFYSEKRLNTIKQSLKRFSPKKPVSEKIWTQIFIK